MTEAQADAVVRLQLGQLAALERDEILKEYQDLRGKIRADGLMEHEMYVMQVKTPDESKAPWDYYKLVQKMSGEEAFGKLADNKACSLVTH